MDHRQFAQLCDLWCSGLSSAAHLSVHPSSSAVINQGMLFSSYCIDRHLQNMLSLWQDVFIRSDIFGNPYVIPPSLEGGGGSPMPHLG